MKNKKMLILIGVAFGFCLFTGKVSQSETGNPTPQLDNKETLFDHDTSTDSVASPLLGFTIESLNPDEPLATLVNDVATESCQAQTEGPKDSTPKKEAHKSMACISNDKMLFELGKLTIQDCNWTSLTSNKKTEIFPFVSALEQKIIMENIKIYFQKDVLTCEASIMFPGSSASVLFRGPCATANSSQFTKINGSKPGSGNYPILAFLSPVEPNNEFIKLIKEKKQAPRNEFTISISIPVSLEASAYFDYMLSQNAMVDCKK